MALPETQAPAGLRLFRRGKVRDVYDLGSELLLVSSDRLSAFDHILPTEIPDKGRILTQISAHWFMRGWAESHFISADFSEISKRLPAGALGQAGGYFDGRCLLARKAERFDAECVVRGYLAGSAWKEYITNGNVCGEKLPKGLVQAAMLPEPVFTPATKADEGHDENISREKFANLVGRETAHELARLSLLLYKASAAELAAKGIILADTKFEFGLIDGRIAVIDEMVTPDSSRLWDAASWRPGTTPESFDKQFVRDYLEKIHWNKNPPIPSLPDDIVAGTTERYRDALRKIIS